MTAVFPPSNGLRLGAVPGLARAGEAHDGRWMLVCAHVSGDRMKLRQLPSLTVLLVVGIGLAVASRGHWRMGSGLIALGLLLAAGLRLVLPGPYAGWLLVRSRAFDAALLLAAGLAVLALAITIPHPG